MAIRRPPTTFSDTISTADIADDAITGGKLANDIAISTTGNIATTGSGALTVAGASNFGSIASGTLGSNVVFPSGQILNTQYDSYSTQTTIGDTNTNILSTTFNTKGANSRIIVLTNLLYGASGDAMGFHGGITMTTGSSASTDYDNDAIQKGATPTDQHRLFGDDIGNGRLNSFGIQVWYANASKVTSFAKDTQITIALWVNGDNVMYVNRSEQRANANEMNISTMVVFEIAQ